MSELGNIGGSLGNSHYFWIVTGKLSSDVLIKYTRVTGRSSSVHGMFLKYYVIVSREKNGMITMKRENTMIRPFGDNMPGGYRHDSLYLYDNLPFFKYDGNIVPSSGRETSPSKLISYNYSLYVRTPKRGICHPYRAMSHEPDKPLKRRNSENIKTIINPQFESL